MIARPTRVRLIGALCQVIGILACIPRAAPDTLETACTGDRVVIVSNNWSQMVDVFATTGQATPIVIGSVRPGGRDELVMPPGATYAYVRSAEARRGMLPPDNRVQIRYRCREQA